MKKVVLKLSLHDDKTKQKVMKTVSRISWVDSIAMDMKDQKLTVTGDIDPVIIVSKLRKLCFTEIVSVGPAKEEKKKEKDKGKNTYKEKENLGVPDYKKAWEAHNPHTRMVVSKTENSVSSETFDKIGPMQRRRELQWLD